jgi:hypothetical protein
MRTPLLTLSIVSLAVGLATPAAHALTDEEVVKAIEKGQDWLMGQQGDGGSWPEKSHHASPTPCGHTEIATFTLVYTGIHPNRDALTRGMDTLLTRNLDYTYAISMRLMAYAYLQRKLSGDKRDMVRKAMKLDAMWLCQAQGSHGGWNYTSLGGSGGRYDFSNTQMAILALREAALAGCEIPEIVWKRAQQLYYENQQDDGSWEYQGKDNEGYGSMTAAGLASIFITMDNLNLASGCPCQGGRSQQGGGEFERRADRTLAWLEKNFDPKTNPKKGGWPKYWLYSVERVGIAAGYKYFGTHNWFLEGAEHLIRSQGGNGAWGDIPQTCFSILFLYKGRAPILYNKLEFDGVWNPHRRDIANLTAYIENQKEQMFHWQIVSLKAPVEELHDAPVLFISAESIPKFSDEHKKKLRAFTDTGGTILFEASCGNQAVRGWAREFFQELWPEWPLKPLGPDHGSFKDPLRLQQRPEIFGKHDGMRTFLFYAMDDISCPWQTKALAGRKYLFDWGINLFTYATDRSPLRAKLAKRLPQEEDRYTDKVRPGEKNALSVVRVTYDDPGWLTNRNYGSWELVKQYVTSAAKVNLTVNEEGTAPADLGEADVAYLTGAGDIPLAADQKQALKAYLEKGGFLWAEAAGGSPAFIGNFRKLVLELGLKFKRIPQTEAILNGRFDGDAKGYSLISGVEFQRSLRVSRLGQKHADLMGLYLDDKLVGVFSMFDILFSTTGYNAYACRGYKAQDAKAVATNILLYLTQR